MFEDLCVHLWRPLLGLSLEFLQVKIKHKPNFHRSRKGEVKASTFPTSPTPPHQQPRPNPLGRVSTCVTELGRKRAWRVGKRCPSCGGARPGTCCLWGIRIPELATCKLAREGKTSFMKGKENATIPVSPGGLQEETGLQGHFTVSSLRAV